MKCFIKIVRKEHLQKKEVLLKMVCNNEITEVEMEACNSFLDRATSIPLVSDTLHYISSKYNHVKGMNKNVGSFLNGTERGLKRITGTAFNFSKKVVPYEYLDKLACGSLDKIEAALPIIKNATQINLPFKSYQTTCSEEVSLTNRMLNKLDHMIDYALPAEESEYSAKIAEKEIVKRMASIASKIKIRILKIAKRVAQLNGEIVTDARSLSAKDMVNVVEHSLYNLHKRLQIKPTEEGILMKTLRLPTRTAVGATLSVIEAAEATLPKVKEQAGMIVMKSKAAAYATYKLVLHISSSAYVNARQKVIVVVGVVKKFERDALVPLLPFSSMLRVTSCPTLLDREPCTKPSNLEERVSFLEKIREENSKEADTSSGNSNNVNGATTLH